MVAALLIVGGIVAIKEGHALRSLAGLDEARPARHPASGFVVVRPQQASGGTVTIDGRYAGRPGERFAVPPGRHRVDVQAPAGGSLTQFVDVPEGGVAVVNGGTQSPTTPHTRIEPLSRQTLTVSPDELSAAIPVQTGNHVLIVSAGRVRAFLPGRIVDLAPGRSTVPVWAPGVVRMISLDSTELSVTVETFR